MNQTLKHILLLIAAVGLLSAVASADQIPVGFVSWDVTSSTTGEFDITNETGPNSGGSFPIATTVTLSSLSLTVDYSDSSTVVYGPSYFTLNGDGISWDGGTIATGGANPQPVDATLTGTFSPLTVTLLDSTTRTILPGFTATIVTSGPGANLNDGDLAIINATTAPVSSVPEPSSWILLATVGAMVLLFRRRQRQRS